MASALAGHTGGLSLAGLRVVEPEVAAVFQPADRARLVATARLPAATPPSETVSADPRAADGRRFTARVVVSAVGGIHLPNLPDLPGLPDFAGENLESWLKWREAGERPVPGYVEDELRGYLECKLLCFGFARAVCMSCRKGFVVAFSCKGRGVCPSCNGRHMAQTAAHLADHVIPPVPVRQWLISVPKRLRGMLATVAAADMLARENSGFPVDASVRITLLDPDVPSYFRSLEHLLRSFARPPFALERLSVIRGADGRISRIRYLLARHKAANWVGRGRVRNSTRPGANGVVELTLFEFLDGLADLSRPRPAHRLGRARASARRPRRLPIVARRTARDQHP